ncbi:hypothetical protein CURTO8I2_90023 [Curtobacterium sp. 8I-2]|nr:hypothetical protein CURTO8I2_90023 [Curtobacterium sp. 8I-2]
MDATRRASARPARSSLTVLGPALVRLHRLRLHRLRLHRVRLYCLRLHPLWSRRLEARITSHGPAARGGAVASVD